MVYQNTEEVKSAITVVITECQKPSAAGPDDIRLILHTLDRLAIFIESSKADFDEGSDDDDDLIPDSTYDTVSKATQIRFPDWGYYNVCADISVKIAETEVLVGDAIDDIADIVGELVEVQWIFDNQTHTHALWHLSFGYRYHWREHLLNLKLYVHALSSERELTD